MLLETARAMGLWSCDALRLAQQDPAALAARARLEELSRESERIGDSARVDRAKLERIIAAKDAAESGLLQGLQAQSSGVPWGLALDLDAARAALSPSDAAISFVLLENALESRATDAPMAAFVLRNEGAAVLVPLADRQEIDAAVADWRAALGTQGAAALPFKQQFAAGDRLRRMVFDPLRGALEGVSRVFVVLDGALQAIPLDALPDGEGVLGDKLSWCTLPTLAALTPILKREAASSEIVLIGGLDYGTGTLPSLTGSGEEIEEVGEIYQRAARIVRRLSGASVDRDQFAAALAQAGVLHIATHGDLSLLREPLSADSTPAQARRSALGSVQNNVRELSPLALCGLALSLANQQSLDGERPGFVRGLELASLDASRCELAVLSACETRAGVARPGASVASLSKSMHMAGARYVLACLWKVDDAQSRELMVAFHRGLVEQSLSPQDALWRAKLLLRSRRLPARAWAGWVLSCADVKTTP
jgi:hypothetical protein